MCWAKEFGEASEEERVAQLAALHEGHAGGGVLAEGQLDTQRILLEQGGTAIKTSISMPLVSNLAAGSAAAAIRQLVRCLFFFF